jgi:enoyl-CoA hydratase/carnithine racemase
MHDVGSYRVGPVGWIKLNRPEVLNAINPAVFAAFADHLAAFVEDAEVRVIAVCGSGHAFSTGADISSLSDGSAAGQQRMMEMGHAMMASVEAAPKPVIAAVHGMAAGGGFELSLACDFVIAERGARFALTEIRFGFVPGGGGTQRLPRRVSRADALYLLCSGEFISAERAAELGLVFRLVEVGGLESAVSELATEFAQRSPSAVGAAKALVTRALSSPLEEGLRAEIEENIQLLQSPETRRAMAAFLDRRRGSSRPERST